MNLIDNFLLDEVSHQAQSNPRLRMNHNFHDSMQSPSQRLLNALEPGTVLPIHRHALTDETYIVLRGKLWVRFYDEDKRVVQRWANRVAILTCVHSTGIWVWQCVKQTIGIL